MTPEVEHSALLLPLLNNEKAQWEERSRGNLSSSKRTSLPSFIFCTKPHSCSHMRESWKEGARHSDLRSPCTKHSDSWNPPHLHTPQLIRQQSCSHPPEPLSCHTISMSCSFLAKKGSWNAKVLKTEDRAKTEEGSLCHWSPPGQSASELYQPAPCMILSKDLCPTLQASTFAMFPHQESPLGESLWRNMSLIIWYGAWQTNVWPSLRVAWVKF